MEHWNGHSVNTEGIRFGCATSAYYKSVKYHFIKDQVSSATRDLIFFQLLTLTRPTNPVVGIVRKVGNNKWELQVKLKAKNHIFLK